MSGAAARTEHVSLLHNRNDVFTRFAAHSTMEQRGGKEEGVSGLAKAQKRGGREAVWRGGKAQCGVAAWRGAAAYRESGTILEVTSRRREHLSDTV